MGETTDMDLAGAAIKAGSSIASGNTKDALETANAGIADQQAKSELAAGSYNAGLIRRKGAITTGAQIAGIGANNLQQGGTNAAVVASTAGATELSALTTQNNALRRAWGFDVQGESDRFQGGLAKQGGILSGVGDLMTGTASAYDKYQENT